MQTPFKQFNEKEQKHGWAINITIKNKRHRRWFPFKHLAEAEILRLKSGTTISYEPEASVYSELDPRLLWLQFSNDALYTTKSPVYRAQLKLAWARFALFYGLEKDLRQLTAQDLRTFAERLKTIHAKESTAKHYYTLVTVVLNAAREVFPVEMGDWHPPSLKLKRVGYSGKRQRRERIITPKELMTIYHGLQRRERYPTEQLGSAELRYNHLADLWALLFLIPKRQNEWWNLEWTQVNFGEGTINFDITKTRDKQGLPMTKTVAEILRRRHTAGEPRPFPEMTHTQLGRPIARVCAAHKIPYGDRTPGGLVPHDIRHTAGTLLSQHGADIPTIGEILGHDLGSGTTPVYMHATPASMLRWLTTLDNMWLSYCRDDDESAAPSKILTAPY